MFELTIGGGPEEVNRIWWNWVSATSPVLRNRRLCDIRYSIKVSRFGAGGYAEPRRQGSRDGGYQDETQGPRFTAASAGRAYRHAACSRTGPFRCHHDSLWWAFANHCAASGNPDPGQAPPSQLHCG